MGDWVHDDLYIIVPGEPTSKARARFTGRGYTSRAYTPENVKAAEAALGWALRQTYPGIEPSASVDFRLDVHFYAGGYQRRDLDNMVKLVCDAFNGVIWKDDSQVTELTATLTKGDPDPRTEVSVAWLEPQRHQRPCARQGCGRMVRFYPSNPAKFCSRYCADKARSNHPKDAGRPLAEPLSEPALQRRREQQREYARRYRAKRKASAE